MNIKKRYKYPSAFLIFPFHPLLFSVFPVLFTAKRNYVGVRIYFANINHAISFLAILDDFVLGDFENQIMCKSFVI